MATTIKYDSADWQSEAFRREALKEARKEARKARKRVIIKIGNTKMGYRAIATIDGRFYVGKITTMGILFITACSGEAFHDSFSGGFSSNSNVDASVPLVSRKDAQEESSQSHNDSAQHDGGNGLRDVSAFITKDVSTQDSAGGPERDSGIQVKDCPSDVSHCDGKAWTGKECSASFLTVCCLDNGLCGCCVG